MTGQNLLSARAVERMMKAEQVLTELEQGRITVKEAAEILGVTERSIRRYRVANRESGTLGLYDRRCLRPSPKRIDESVREEVTRLYREMYGGFNVKHFHEKLVERHAIHASYSWVKGVLQQAGLVSRKKKRGTYRRRRPRRPMKGMLLHLDGSTHAWLGADHPTRDLLVVMDDATSEVYAAHFVVEESTLTCMAILRTVIEQKGAFAALYTDRAGHFVVTKDARKGPDRSVQTQVERALGELDIRLICAKSPEARGRSERLFETWQDRLVSELRLANVQNYGEAQRFVDASFIPWHNRTLTVAPIESASAFTQTTRRDLARIFSTHHVRYVQKDHTVHFNSKRFQIPERATQGESFAKKRVTLHQYPDGLIEIRYGQRALGCYLPSGLWRCTHHPLTRS